MPPVSSDNFSGVPIQPNSPLEKLVRGLVDYAGLFPPAGLDLGHMVENFSSYLAGPHAELLGRCIVPVSRLEELGQRLSLRPVTDTRPWRLSVLAGENFAADWAAINAFNLRHQDARIVSIEAKATSPAEIRQLSAAFPPLVELWIEIPVGEEFSPFLSTLARAGRGAKIRTGGITPAAFPPAPQVAGFLASCHRAGVVAKATAGLHHPLSAVHPLTYEPGAPTAPMYGFLNVFLAAALARTGASEDVLASLLVDRDPANFRCTSDAIAWRDHAFTSSDLADMRKHLLRSFGSCSFREPIEGLHVLGWL